jgi:hypothetical protein
MKRGLASIAAIAITTLLGASAAFAQGAAPASNEKNWSVEVYPVLAFVPVMGINFRLPPAPPCTGCDPSEPSGDASAGLSGAYFGAARVEVGRFELYGDFNYAGVTANKERPLANVDVTLTAGSLYGGFEVLKGLYGEVGGRYYSLDFTLNVGTFPKVSWNPVKWTPLVGASFRPQLGKRWRVDTHIDWAGLGGGALSSTNGQARLEWMPINHISLTGGYGFAKMKANGQIKSKDISLDYTLHGPVLGIGITF